MNEPLGGLYAPLPSGRQEPTHDGWLVPASRTDRFFAKVADNLLLYAPLFLTGLIAGALTPHSAGAEPPVAVWIAGGLASLVVPTIQAVLLARDGQTIGKKWRRIRIVTMDGRNPGFARAVLVRTGVALVLGLACRGIGSLVDALMIYREDRRCLHDHAAGTQVVLVP